MTLFMMLAALGFIASFLVHVSTFAGLNPSAIPGIWGLHIGIFVVFLPALICGKKFEAEDSTKDFWQVALRYIPAWLPVLVGLFFAYTFFNFFFTIFVLLEGGGPHIVDGQYVLSNHGEIIRQLTEAEYIKCHAYEIRLFSGHWMVFYLSSFAVLLSHVTKNRLGPKL